MVSNRLFCEQIFLNNAKIGATTILRDTIRGKELDNPYELGSRFSQFRETTNSGDIASAWRQDRNNSRTRRNRGASKRLFIILLILVLIVLYILDFDLSIFRN